MKDSRVPRARVSGRARLHLDKADGPIEKLREPVSDAAPKDSRADDAYIEMTISDLGCRQNPAIRPSVV